jgi:acetylornithine deacetylase
MLPAPAPDLLDRVIDRLCRFIDIPSATGEEEAYAHAAAAALGELGFTVELRPVAPGRPNVLARRGSGRLLFATHLDTVPPFVPARRGPDRVSGRGACDTKGLFACMLEAAAELIAEGCGDLAFLLVVGEEVDHAGAKAAASYGLRADAVLLGEPTERALMRAQKGILRLTLEAAGHAAHSGYPEQGESAIEKLLAALARIRGLPLGADPLLGPGYLNIGVIQGGVAANVLAPAASAEILLRTVSPGAELVSRIQAAAGDLVQVRVGTLTDPVRLHVLDGYATGVAGFATDAPYLAAIGPVVLAGPGSILDAHTADEHITHAELLGGVALYADLARRLLGGAPLRAAGGGVD